MSVFSNIPSSEVISSRDLVYSASLLRFWGVLANTKLYDLAESFIQLVKIVPIFRNLAEGKILGVDDFLVEVEVLGNKVFTTFMMNTRWT